MQDIGHRRLRIPVPRTWVNSVGFVESCAERKPVEEVPMPWMPEVFTAPIAEARRAQDIGTANDTLPYYQGIMAGEPEALVRSFAAHQPVLDDPRVGYVEGARGLRAFVNRTAQWLREHDAVVENVALTLTPTRTVEEVVLYLREDDSERVSCPW